MMVGSGRDSDGGGEGEESSGTLHAFLAAALDGLLHVLRPGRPVVALEGQPPAPHPEGGAAGGRSGWSGDGLAFPAARRPPAATPTLHPGVGLGGLAAGLATLQPVEVPHHLALA